MGLGLTPLPSVKGLGVQRQVLLLLVRHCFEGFPLIAFIGKKRTLIAFIGKKEFIPVNQDLSNNTFHIIK